MAGRHNIDAADTRHLQSADDNIGHDTATTGPGQCRAAEGPARSWISIDEAI